MPFFYTPPVEPQIQLVTPARITTAEMHAQFPPGDALRGKYCRVSDMWGLSDGMYRCGYNGRIYFWEPTTTPQLFSQMPVTGNMTVQPLSSPPLLELVGGVIALGTTWNVTLGTDNLPPGIVREIRPAVTSILGALNITGLGLGSTVSMLLGSSRRFASWDNGSAVVWRQLT